MLWLFLKELYKFSQRNLIYCLFLMLLVGLLDGIGVLFILPLMELVYPHPLPSNNLWLNQLIHHLGFSVNLPLILLFYVLVGGISAWIVRKQSLVAVKIQQKFANYLSARVYCAISLTKWQYLLVKSRANFTNTLTTELSRVTSGVSLLLQLISSASITIIQVIISLYIAPKLTLLVLACGIVVFIMFYYFTKRAKKIGTHLLYSNQKVMFQVSEYLNGIKEVKSYRLHDQEISKFKQFRESASLDIIKNMQIQSQVTFLYKIVALIMVSSVFFIAVYFYKTPLAVMVMLLFIFARIWPRISSISNLLTYVAAMLPALHDILQTEKDLLSHQETKSLNSAAKFILKQQIEFKHVYFRYKADSQKYNLTDISFLIPVGSTTAVVGMSGSGKSTLADLLIGLLRPESGEILIDNEDLSEHTNVWGHSIAYVPQDNFLFNDTISNNLTWACPNASINEVWDALKMVALDTFVAHLPNGLDTIIGDRGVLLSGGERQRLVLARAILRQPSLLILDEATSALDDKNEHVIQAAIESLHGKLTTCIIAHRLATIMHADQIIVLQDGHLREIGTYESLLQDASSYFNYLFQFGVKVI